MENEDTNHSEPHTEDDLVKLINNLEVLDEDSESNVGLGQCSDNEFNMGQQMETGSASADESRDIHERIRTIDDEGAAGSPTMSWAEVLRETVYMHAAFRIAAIVDGAVELGDRIARDVRDSEANTLSATQENLTCAKSKCTSTNRKRDEVMSKTRPRSKSCDQKDDE